MKLEYDEYRNIRKKGGGIDYTSVMPEYALSIGLNPEDVTADGWNWAYGTYKDMWSNIARRREAGCYCKECGDLQMIPVITWEKDLGNWYVGVRTCECQNRRSVMNNISKSGIAQEANAKNFHTFKRDTDFRESLYQHAVDYLKAIKDGKKPWFYIGGQTGAGKTHLCTAIANRFLQNNYRLRYMRWIDEAYKTASERDNLQQYKEAEVLYIDDLFKTKPTDYMLGIAFELINYRDTNNLITIISSELQSDALRETDTAIYGRVRMHTGKEFMISITAGDDKNYREESTKEQ